MFCNFRMYQLTSDWPASEEGLSRRLEDDAFKPCGAYVEQSAGWEAPGGEGELLARRVGGADLLRLRIQSKVLPAAAINEALDDRIIAFKQRTQRDPSRREKRELKDEVHSELTPKALVKSSRIWGAVLLSESIVLVDTTSESQAELFLDTLRHALGSLKVTPLAFKKPVASLLTQVFLGSGPPQFIAGRECRMLDPTVGRASVSWLDIDLADSSVKKHVQDGLHLDRLAMSFDDILTMVLDQEGVIRKFRLEGMDEADLGDDDHPLAQLDAQFVVTMAAAARVLAALKKQLGGYD